MENTIILVIDEKEVSPEDLERIENAVVRARQRALAMRIGPIRPSLIIGRPMVKDITIN